jgi:glutamate:GABA antiporter
MTKSKKNTIGIFTLTMLCVATVMSLRGLPLMASEGLTMFFYIIFSAIFFLVPISLVCAELATGWPSDGGIYRWIKEAFGEKTAFVGVWLQWSANVVWYPTILAFAAGSLAYLFLDKSLAANKYFNVTIILLFYWLSTFITLKGVRIAGKISSIGVILGTLIPGILIIFLAMLWIFMGHPIEILQSGSGNLTSYFPDFTKFNTISTLAVIVFLFTGMEVGAVHVMSINNPKKNYPIAVFSTMFLVIVIYMVASFSLGVVMPLAEIQHNLNAGIMAGFGGLFKTFNINWLLPVMGLFITFGSFACVIAWVGGPCRAVLAAAEDGTVPPFLRKKNKNGVPTNILFVQGCAVTCLSLVFLIMPSVSSAYFVLAVLTAAPYMIMYIMVYLSAIRLRHTQPQIERSYKVPGGKLGMWLISGIGIIAILFALVLEFFPPTDLPVGGPVFYISFLTTLTILFILTPFVIIAFKKPDWKKNANSIDFEKRSDYNLYSKSGERLRKS